MGQVRSCVTIQSGVPVSQAPVARPSLSFFFFYKQKRAPSPSVLLLVMPGNELGVTSGMQRGAPLAFSLMEWMHGSLTCVFNMYLR